MKKIIRTSVFMFAVSLAGSTITPLLAAPMPQQQGRHDRDDQMRDQDRDRDRGHVDDAAYFNNKYYQQGWKDGEHHKHKNKKWKNDDDRRAYEAGYMHGDRGEPWQQHQRHDNDDRHEH